MIRHVDEDKLALRKKVEAALKILINENLIRQNLQSYVFQTDEEQEVTRLINNIELNVTDVENKLAVDIFDGKIGKNSFTYQNAHATGRAFENRYNFSYNLYVDDYAYRKNSNPQLEVKVITPYYDEIWNDETQLVLQSTKNQMLVNLPVDQEFMNHINTYLKVEKYITTANASSAIKNFAAVKAEKTTENQELSVSIQAQLDDFLKQATFYFNNNKLVVSGTDFKSRLNDALQQMAKLVYHKNDLVDSAISESDINNFLKENGSGLIAHNENQNVVDEVKRYIQLQQSKNLTITIKSLRDNFINKEPYGFVNEDLEWAIARLFKEGSINLFKNAIPLSTTDDVSDISKAVFERKAPEKIRIELRQKANDSQKKMVKELGDALFESRNIVDENNDDTTHTRFNEKAQRMITEFNGFMDTPGKYYPQSNLIADAVKSLQQVVDARDTKSFFEVLKNKEEDLLDWAEDFEDIRNFHTSNQKVIWDKANDYINRIEGSTIKESTTEIDKIIANMKNIMKQATPYREIPKLSELNTQFEVEYLKFMGAKSDTASNKVKAAKQVVLDDLASRDLGDDFKAEVFTKFDKLVDDLASYQRLDQIELAPVQAESLQRTFTNKFTAEENRRREESARQASEKAQMTQPTATKEPSGAEVHESYTSISVKKVETVYVNSLIKSRNRVKSAADVDEFVNKLKQELLAKLNDDNELDILL